MEHLEALMIHFLGSESVNIFLNELKVCLEGLDGVAKVVLENGFGKVSEVGTDGSDTGSTIEILSVKKFVDVLLEGVSATVHIEVESLDDS
jgi:hypothetical protein